MAKQQYEIPFDEWGNLLSYPGYGKITWRENYVFDDTLMFARFERGRSAAHAIWISATSGQQFPMFLTDLSALFLSGIKNNRATGRWTFCKRGSNYGIRLAEETK